MAVSLNRTFRFTLIVDSQAVLRNTTERSFTPFTVSPNGDILQNWSTKRNHSQNIGSKHSQDTEYFYQHKDAFIVL